MEHSVPRVRAAAQPTGGAAAAPVTRRAALGLLAGAAAGAAGCDRPRRQLVPYVQVPEHELPGEPLEYATTLGSVHGFGHGVIVTTYTGRPTKVEGNPSHPASLGATDVFAQAALVDLYDPRRSQAPRYGTGVTSTDAFFAALEHAVAPTRAARGSGLCIVTPAHASPSEVRILSALLDAQPNVRWYRYDPVPLDAPRNASRAALGRPLDVLYRLDRARRIVSLDADLLNGVPGHLAYARRWADARARLGADMPRLYSVESSLTATGARADHRLALPASRVEAFAFGLAAQLGVPGAREFDGDERERAWLAAVARDLKSQRGASVVVPGPYLPRATHEVCHWINAALHAQSGPLAYVPEIAAARGAADGGLEDLLAELRAGRVAALLIVDRNPVYDSPSGAELAELLPLAPFAAHVGLRRDETARATTWHVPLLHDFESWRDWRAFDGTVSVSQPVIPPLTAGVATLEVYAALAGGERLSTRAVVRETTELGLHGPEDRDAPWRDVLRNGVVPDSAATPVAAAVRGAPPEQPAATPRAGLELHLRPDSKLWDGRFAGNDWLQELPDPFSTRQWGNALEISTATASALGARSGDELELSLPSGARVVGAAYVSPAAADDAVVASLGYGRAEQRERETRSSFDAFRLRARPSQWSVPGAALRKTGARAELVLRQPQLSPEGRSPARRGTLAGFRENADFLRTDVPDVSLYPVRHKNPDYRWALSIDLNRCIGCAACTAACQAENNIPTVGRDQAALGRSMHWIRVDRYHGEDADAGQTLVQPVPCMHCENAPCEYVCPVGATVHDTEGLNAMVYNRCIGTRDCSQNCPYKVRRFNWLDWSYHSGEDWAPLRNPNVTVRSRGVMEKCTYCVQRISAARQTAQIEGRRIRDGELRTACQAVCPTEAIVFGDLDTPGSAIATRRADPLDYTLLAELNTRPRTSYRARIDNPNPDIESSS
jgi:Fe-S-cluster-containing dehydrogenase component